MSILLKILAGMIPVLLAITLHEAAHAWVANRLGDDTAKRLGRLSFNPFRHIDLIGTIIVPLFIVIITQFQFVFGWAKPVPLDPRKLKHGRRDEALVAAAGPLTNFIMAVLWVYGMKLTLSPFPLTTWEQFLLFAAQTGVAINLVLLFINLIPIPPLDGSRIIASILPPKYAAQYMKIEPYGFLILLVLLFSQLLGRIIEPALIWTYQALLTLI